MFNRKTMVLFLVLFSMGLHRQANADLVVAIDLSDERAIREGVSGQRNFRQEQDWLEKKLRVDLMMRGVRRVKTPHIVLFDGIPDTEANIRAIKRLFGNFMFEADVSGSMSMSVGRLRTQGDWGKQYFSLALDVKDEGEGQPDLFFSNTLDVIEKLLHDEGIYQYNKKNTDALHVPFGYKIKNREYVFCLVPF